MYDGVLKLRLPKSAHIVGFADRIALMLRLKNLDKLMRTCITAVGKVSSWITGISLKFADHKTDVLLISSRTR